MRQAYDRTFEILKPGDLFITGSGNWIVYFKYEKTLIAYKQNNVDKHLWFDNYDFPDDWAKYET